MRLGEVYLEPQVWLEFCSFRKEEPPEKEDKVGLSEIYYKGDKENENRKRISNYCRR